MITVSKEFAQNFKKVCNHYSCNEDEIEVMKGWVRNDYAAMKIWFAGIVQEIDAANGGGNK